MTTAFKEQLSSLRYRTFLRSHGKAANTLRTYGNGAELYWRWCQEYDLNPETADHAMVRTYLGEVLGRVSSGRAHNVLAAVRNYYAMLIEDGVRSDDPTTGLKVKRRQALPTKPLTVAEVTALLGACQSERDTLIILFLTRTGVRISELANLAVKDIDFTNGQLRVLGKGDKERWLALPENLLGRLRIYLGLFPDQHLFLSEVRKAPLAAHQIRKIIYGIAKDARLEHVHPHRFRATFATEFMTAFKDIQALQGLLGHEDITTTARYAEWTKASRGLDMMRMMTLGGGLD